MSKRDAPTAMNSIAQQAVPSGKGHSALWRAQLTIALIDVRTTFCFSSSGISTSESLGS
jgi:hypothetical protein